MRRIAYILAWASLGAASIIVVARYYSPALFSQEVLYAFIAAACVFAALSIARKKYE